DGRMILDELLHRICNTHEDHGDIDIVVRKRFHRVREKPDGVLVTDPVELVKDDDDMLHGGEGGEYGDDVAWRHVCRQLVAHRAALLAGPSTKTRSAWRGDG